MDLVAFPFVDFRKCENEGYRTRDAHLIREFSRNPAIGRVLVVNRPMSTAEILLKRRRWRMRTGELVARGAGSWITRLRDGLFVLDMLVPDLISPVILRHAWWARVMGTGRVRAEVLRAMRLLELSDVHLHLFTPLAYPMIGALGEACRVFFAIDNWLVHPQLRSGRVEVVRAYELLKQEADAIVTTSDALSEFFARERGCVQTVLNGVNPAMFRAEGREVPADLKGIPRPIVGYAGKIQERLDLGLVRHVVRSMPDVSFVFIGQITSPTHFARLGRFPNLHYLGDKTYEQLPNYLRAFDACIIPHEGEGLAASMSPLKVYEYLASDRPVVATRLAGLQEIPGWLSMAETRDEFLAALRSALARPEGRFPMPEEWSWSARAQEVLSVVAKCCADKATGS